MLFTYLIMSKLKFQNKIKPIYNISMLKYFKLFDLFYIQFSSLIKIIL